MFRYVVHLKKQRERVQKINKMKNYILFNIILLNYDIFYLLLFIKANTGRKTVKMNQHTMVF